MKDNRGLSLVELLITVTILALVIIGAATFMLTGSRSFAKGSADSNVQGEAELAVNQIEDLIIDVNGGVDFTDDTDASTLTMYHVEADDSSGVAVNKKRTVTWDKNDNNLYSSEWKVDKDGSGVYVELDPPVYKNQLLAENVTDFNVDLSDKYTETAKDGTDIEIVRSVVIRVDCLDGTGKATYATTPTITLRNRLMLSADPGEIFEQTPTPDDSLLLYISDTGMEGALPVRDRVTTVERGKVYNIFAMVNAGTNVNSLCNFTVEGETSGTASSITPEGVHIALDVNDSEPNDYLKITATYKTNSAKYVIGWVKVIGGTGKSLDWVKIIPMGDDPVFTVHYDSEYHTTDFTDEDEALLKYTWEVVEASRVESFTSTNKTLDLTIIQKSENYNKQLEIILTLYSPTTNQSVSDRVYYNIPPERTLGGDSVMERGKGVGGVSGGYGENWYWFWPPVVDGECWCQIASYDYYFCDKDGNRINVEPELKDHVLLDMNGGDLGVPYDFGEGKKINYWLTVDKDLPADREFYIMVEVNFEYKNGSTWNYSRIHYISNVQLYGQTTTSTGNVNSGFDFYYKVIGYYCNTWQEEPHVFDYDITLDYEAPAGVTVEPEGLPWNDTNVVAGTPKMLRGYSNFKVINNSGLYDWQVYGDIKIKSATVKVYMKEYPSVYTYCYVKFV
ncbi:MAG: prepilin-type N-terminal cleavage/methylation domain-containing protein [Lachnospiraceae bacterium]|nr:prepilin-type N-terminal cleavage/methylation domain-containing protein [Lachnospiraceae bacterium]